MFIPDTVLDHVRAVTDEPDLAGTKYRLLRRVGRGGMASVYLVEDTELGREVALKVSSAAGGSELCARLRREAQVIARLEHPGIVPVHDVGELPDGRVFYVMKLVKGQRLDEWLRPAPPLRAVLRLFQRICEAVAFAHAHGVVHRDLKPENLMVGEFGEALVMDWGIAKELATGSGASGEGEASPPDEAAALAATLPAGTPTATAQGTVIGTPSFMSPEQASGDVRAVDARSDVYALGAILYFLLTGRPPHTGTRAEEILASVRNAAPVPVRSVAPAVPRAVASICAMAMARDSAARYSTAADVADDVGRFLDELPVVAHRETLVERATRFVSRHRVILSLLAVYVVVRLLLALFAGS